MVRERKVGFHLFYKKEAKNGSLVKGVAAIKSLTKEGALLYSLAAVISNNKYRYIHCMAHRFYGGAQYHILHHFMTV